VIERRPPAGESARDAELERQLRPLGVTALVVLGATPGEPDLAPFLRGARLGEAFVVAPMGGAPRLGYWTPMERDEAAATGLDLLSPELLELPRLARENPDPARYLAAVLAAALERCGVGPSRVALGGSGAAGTLAEAAAILRDAGWELVGASAALRRWRKRKAEAEIAGVRRAAAATCEAFRRVAGALAASRVEPAGALELEGEPLTVARLKRAVALHFAGAGLTQPRENIIAPGEEGGVPHTTGTPERVLRAGESLIVDLFPRGELFADCTRTFCVGEAPEALRRAHADTLAALELAHGATRVGERGWEIQKQVCELLGARG
jgi:Xaa-Pro aminopeptidase